MTAPSAPPRLPTTVASKKCQHHTDHDHGYDAARALELVEHRESLRVAGLRGRLIDTVDELVADLVSFVLNGHDHHAEDGGHHEPYGAADRPNSAPVKGLMRNPGSDWR